MLFAHTHKKTRQCFLLKICIIFVKLIFSEFSDKKIEMQLKMKSFDLEYLSLNIILLTALECPLYDFFNFRKHAAWDGHETGGKKSS